MRKARAFAREYTFVGPSGGSVLSEFRATTQKPPHPQPLSSVYVGICYLEEDSNEEARGQISEAQQLRYNRLLAAQAHSRGLAVGQRNATGLTATLVGEFDFAVNEQCFAYDRECSVYETSFLAANKPVFNQEYSAPAEEPEGSVSKTSFEGTACPYFRSRHIASLWKTGLNLNVQGVAQCQP